MKRIAILLGVLYLCVSANAQENTQQFLWFSGHWSKTQKNTFITTAYKDTLGGKSIQMGGGSTITVAATGKVTISSPGIDNWNKNIDEGEKSLDNSIKEMKAPSNEISQWSYHINEVTVPLLDSLKSQWGNLKVEKKDDPVNPEDKETKALQNFGASLNETCEKIKSQYQAIINFYNAHRNDKESDYNNPQPPAFDNTCIVCNPDLQKEHDKEAANYADNFFKPESDLEKNGINILHQLLSIGRANDIDNSTPNVSMSAGMNEKVEQSFHQGKSDPSKSGACAYIKGDELNRAVQFLAMRMYWRADKLLRDNKNNFQAAPSVIKTFLIAVRNCELMGFKVDENFPALASLIKQEFDYYNNKLVKDHDWSQLGNIPFIIELARQYQLLSGQQTDDAFLSEIFKILNGFQLKIEMDIKGGKDGGYMIAHLKGKAKIAPEFRYAGDSCYQWVLIEDKPNSLGMPVVKSDLKIPVDLLDNELIAQSYTAKYVGTKKYSCILQQLKMNYCHPGMDTILLGGFTPEPNIMAGTWQYPKDPNLVPAGINSLDRWFQDYNKMQQYAQSGQAQQDANEMKEQAEKMASQMKAMQQQMGTKRGASQVGNYQQMLNMASKMQQTMNTKGLGQTLFIDFPLKIENNSTTLFKEQFDVKEVNPKMAENIVYGYYTIDIEFTGGQ